MANAEVLEETPISMVELKAELKRIKKRDGELSFRANKTEEYLNQFSIDTQKHYKELFDALEKLKVPRLKDFHMIKLIDIKPQTADEVKMVLDAYTITVTAENCKKIAKVFS